MATVYPIVTGEDYIIIPTNKGDLAVYICDIDRELTVGDTIAFDSSHILRPIIGCPMVSNYNSGAITYTNFITLDNKFSYTDGAVSLLADGHDEPFTTTIRPSSSSKFGYVGCILRTPNGIGFPYGGTTIIATTNANNAVYDLNTSDNFGYVTRSLFTAGASFLVTQNLLDAGTTILNMAQPVFDDPYADGGLSDEGGGGGDFTSGHTPVNFPSAPTGTAVDTNFIKLYAPTLAELRRFASYLWSSSFDIDTFKKLFGDPMDAVLGLSILPFSVPTSGSVSGIIGNIDTGQYMTVASGQYVDIDCGTVTINEYWGAYMDYSPYTKIDLYLPYIGMRPISADDVMGKTINVLYRVDILSGSCVAFIKCGDTVLYSFIGQCSSPIPITANNWVGVINGALSIAGAIGTTIATGGATAPMAVSSVASNIVNNFKPEIERSGAISGTGGLMGIQFPYFIITRPRQCVPASQNAFIGYPSFTTVSLGDLSGYTEVESIHLENIPATGAELSEIENLLKSGVIF